MFRSVWDFLKRHRKKFAFSGVVITGGYFLLRALQRKIKEDEDRDAAEYLNHTKRQHHFDSNQRTCNLTVLSMIPTLRECLRKSFHTEAIKEQLKAKPKPNNKLELWEQLKIAAFSRAISSVYCSCLLVLLLRVQLNIIGGHMFALMGHCGIEEDEDSVPQRVQERYLSLIQYFLKYGVENVILAIQEAVRQTIGPKSLKQKFSLQDLQADIKSIRRILETGDRNSEDLKLAAITTTTSESLLSMSEVSEKPHSTFPIIQYLLPPEHQQDLEGGNDREVMFYEKLVSETRDTLECPDFQNVLLLCLNKSFDTLMDYIAETYKLQGQEIFDQTDLIKSVHHIQIPLAKLIPVVDRLLYRVCDDAPNTFIQDLLMMEHLQNFAANVYEAFSQNVEPQHTL